MTTTIVGKHSQAAKSFMQPASTVIILILSLFFGLEAATTFDSESSRSSKPAPNSDVTPVRSLRSNAHIESCTRSFNNRGPWK
ncbi:hypothetical protein BDR03DRAFT_959897 [Suillus americanus]|nr:hypothetical protein BDR03DRAFT_959897 [Suillus americanus]